MTIKTTSYGFLPRRFTSFAFKPLPNVSFQSTSACFVGTITGDIDYSEVVVSDRTFGFHLYSARFFSSALTTFNLGYGADGDPETVIIAEGVVSGDSTTFKLDQDVPKLGYLQLDILDTFDGLGGAVTLHYDICYTV